MKNETIDLGSYAAWLTGLTLSGEQVMACETLQRAFRADKGGEVYIGPFKKPQSGLTTILGFAFPCWILTCDPLNRIRLVSYNLSHGYRLSNRIRRKMGDLGMGELRSQSTGSWTTNSRRLLANSDDQASLEVLSTHQVDRGVEIDTLIVTDPIMATCHREQDLKALSTFMRDTVLPRINTKSKLFFEELPR